MLGYFLNLSKLFVYFRRSFHNTITNKVRYLNVNGNSKDGVLGIRT